jgi:hypothetical protein
MLWISSSHWPRWHRYRPRRHSIMNKKPNEREGERDNHPPPCFRCARVACVRGQGHHSTTCRRITCVTVTPTVFDSQTECLNLFCHRMSEQDQRFSKRTPTGAFAFPLALGGGPALLSSKSRHRALDRTKRWLAGVGPTDCVSR